MSIRTYLIKLIERQKELSDILIEQSCYYPNLLNIGGISLPVVLQDNANKSPIYWLP